MKFAFVAKHRGIWPVAMVVRGARCLARGLLCLADAGPERIAARSDEALGAKVRASFLQPAIAPTARGGSGTTCWQRVSRAGCIGSSG